MTRLSASRSAPLRRRLSTGAVAVAFALQAVTAAAQSPVAVGPKKQTSQKTAPEAEDLRTAPRPDENYQQGLDLYEGGDYALAANAFALFLLSPPVGFDPEKLKRARLYRGICLYQVGDQEGAHKEFWQVLLMDPDFRPDPLFTEPAVIASFDRIRAENAEELKKIPRPPKRVANPDRDPLGIPLARRSDEPGLGADFWRSIAPFGVAQFHNEDPTKAYVILGLESSLLIANLSTAVAFYSLRKDRNRFDPADVPDGRLLKNVNNASFFLLVGVLFYGSADGIWNATQRRNRVPARPLVPTPAPGPGQAGLSLEWQF